jgi:hypothetical protein
MIRIYKIFKKLMEKDRFKNSLESISWLWQNIFAQMSRNARDAANAAFILGKRMFLQRQRT